MRGPLSTFRLGRSEWLIFCGLDFGTSNSTIATVKDGTAFQIPIEDDHLEMPSAIFYNGFTKEVFFGREAMGIYLDGDEGRLMRSIKSILGTSLIDTRTNLSNRSIALKSVIADFIKETKARAEEKMGCEPDQYRSRATCQLHK
jgi:hypothetical chaperone protein